MDNVTTTGVENTTATGTENNQEPENKTQEQEVVLPQNAEDLQKMLQSETDKRVTQALKTAQQKWETEWSAKIEAEKQEATKLAKMSAAEREQAKFQKEKEEFEKQRKEFAIQRLEMETIRQLETEKLPIKFSRYLLGNDAEKTLENINEFKEMWRSAIEEEVSNRLKGSSPLKLNTTGASGMTKEQFQALSYGQRMELFNTNPDLYKKLSEI